MKNRYIIYGLVFSLTCSFAHAQQVPVKEKKMGDSGTPTFLLFDTDSTQYQKGEEETIWKEYLNITSSDQLEKVKSRTDKQGMEHLVFQQYYKGIKVENATFRVHIKEGMVESVNGNFIKIDNLNINPALSGEEAVLIALKNTNAQKYAWESEGMEKTLKEETGRALASYYPEAELVIWHPYRKNETSLAYKIEVYSLEPYNHEYVYVDANNGAVLDRDPISIPSAVTGTADTRYSGSQNLTTDSFVSGYRLRDPSRGNGIETYDMNEGTDYGNAVDFVDNNNTWTAAEWHNLQMNDAALDAHWALQEVYDYFVAEHGRESYDDANGKVKCYVHFDEDWGNAEWDGDRIRLGDGNTDYRILAAFDVIAHEFGHGVCQETCDLEYEGESGAINEGLSDIWAATIEEYSAPAKQEWRIGEEITLTAAALRAMDNPNLFDQPDTYGGTFWINPNCGTPTQYNDYCGVHTNSGVMNFWFYLLSEGDGNTYTNDNGDCYSVEGIGMEDAAEIVYKMEADYLYNESDFDDARTYSIQAVRNLYGYNSNEEVQVTNAWYAVGVGDEYHYQVSGPSEACYYSNGAYTVDYLPDGHTITWDNSDNLTRVSAQGANPCTFNALSMDISDFGWIEATIYNECEDSVTTSREYIWVGPPLIRYISGPEYPQTNNPYQYAAVLEHYELDYDYYWYVSGGSYSLTQGDNGYTATITFYDPYEYYTIEVGVENECGDSWGDTEVYVGQGYLLSILPNPASGEATITVETGEEDGSGGDAGWDLEIYSETQLPKTKQTGLRGQSAKIQTSGWKEGVYMVRVNYNNEILTGKLVVKK